MLPTEPPKILILADDAAVARRWAEALAGVAEVWHATSEIPPATRIDVLVTDLSPHEAAQRSGLGLGGNARPSPASPGVIAIGAADWADLALPADSAQREVRLACRLLGEIVRLRIACDEIAKAQREIAVLAETDPLTGLANRRAWDRQLALKWTHAQSSGQPLWLAIVDLDLFKMVNDRDGYAAGDRLLEGVAQRLKVQVRQGDIIVRLGGDEFGVLLSGVTHVQSLAVLDRLRSAVAEYDAPGNACPLTASIGCSSGEGRADPGELFAAAELALRQAKRAGGNRVCVP